MSHYSCAQKLHKLKRFAKYSAAEIARNIKGKNAYQYALVYSGMSGTALATAVSLELLATYDVLISMIYVRKQSERSHGDSIETSISLGEENLRLIFIDDFIESGKTLEYVLDRVNHWRSFWGREPSYLMPSLLVLECYEGEFAVVPTKYRKIDNLLKRHADRVR